MSLSFKLLHRVAIVPFEWMMFSSIGSNVEVINFITLFQGVIIARGAEGCHQFSRCRLVGDDNWGDR